MAPPASITSVSPTSGPSAGGTTVVITGQDFMQGFTMGVKFGPNAASGFTINSPTQITVVSPAGSGNVPVTLTLHSQANGGSSAKFTYV